MDTKEYITSERFIWDGIKAQAEKGIQYLQEMWKTEGRIGPMAVSWPTEHVKAQDGQEIGGPIFMDLDNLDVSHALRLLVTSTKSYALLLVEQQGAVVVATLESFHGSRCWRMDVARHGDVDVLGEATVEDDKASIGLLWKKNQVAS